MLNWPFVIENKSIPKSFIEQSISNCRSNLGYYLKDSKVPDLYILIPSIIPNSFVVPKSSIESLIESYKCKVIEAAL
jgi:hypothetical protein